MKRITSTLLVAALPALGLSTSLLGSLGASAPQQQQQQQQGSQDGGDGVEVDVNPPPEGFDTDSRVGIDIFGRRTRVRGNTFAERIRGGWRLERLVIPGSNPRGRIAQGFMHIGESFMSLELHALYEGSSAQDVTESDFHTAFTAEYQINSGGGMFCSTVIGSYLDEETGELRWERTGFEREYRVRETLEQLELTFTDPETGIGKMYFRPYLPRTLGSTDIFGRKEIGSFGDTDIFGRPKASEKGERDIYGRPGPVPEGEESETESGKRPTSINFPKGPGAGGSPLSRRGGR